MYLLLFCTFIIYLLTNDLIISNLLLSIYLILSVYVSLLVFILNPIKKISMSKYLLF